MASLILLPGWYAFGFNFKTLVFIPILVFADREALKENEGVKHIAISLVIVTTTALWISLLACAQTPIGMP